MECPCRRWEGVHLLTGDLRFERCGRNGFDDIGKVQVGDALEDARSCRVPLYSA